MLELEDFSVAYADGFEAVHSVSLRVETGQIAVILGPSGCGKSSLLRGVAGLETSGGRVRVSAANGHVRDVTRVPTHKRGVGMVFQDGQLFPNLTVGQNIAYGDRHVNVDRYLELIDLAGFADRRVQTLSGGQAQRVALARSLAARPDVLLLDEPLSALDEDLRMDLARIVRRILADTSTTALYVTHNRDEAGVVGDRVLHMDAGRFVD
ncbi:ABC transporter ATP-binding protein [Neoactinobaculum massilliense]|uniref:ABC transporter ATP-binding protein n=1 Tax=Neoactinobaculum massilliense TaxID=2364794 RepID=UPI001F156D12|nr:ABC transporter ATP-binding protein [Neoactinobaculum massilliense]